MRWLVVSLVAGAVLQAMVLPGLVGNGIRPDLTLIVVVAWATFRGWEEGILVGLLGGFLLDVFSAAPFGVSVVRLALVGGAAGLVMDRIGRTSVLMPAVAAGVASLAAFALSVLALQASGWVAAWESALLVSAVPSAVLTGLCMAVAYPVLRALMGEHEAVEEGGIL
ncbi:MAG: rod shape-determining protein MreD [Chloroflexi bacterium]|nr:rod shape-determining protein MreD [Chloroflexota bacterium]